MTFPHASLLIVTPRLGRWIALALLLSTTPPLGALNIPQRPGTATSVTRAAERPASAGRYRGPRTYLAMLGPSPLYFEEAPPPLPPEPEMPKPPAPPLAPPEPDEAKAPKPESTPQDLGPADVKPEAQPGTRPSTKPVSILPDDIPQEIRAEDVIPFFQFPGSGSEGVTVAVPFSPAQPRAPALPASSATYQQR